MPVNAVLQYLQANQSTVLLVAAIAGVGYLVYREVDQRAFKGYDHKSLSERVLPDLKFRIHKLGKISDRELIRGSFQSIGTVYKYVEMEKNDEFVLTPGNPAQTSDEDSDEKVLAFLITPEGYFSRKAWYLSDILFGRNNQSTVIVCYRDALDDTETDAFKLKEGTEFSRYGGVLVQEGNAPLNVVQEVAYRDALEETTNSFPSFAEKVAENNPQHAENMSEIKEINEQNKRQALKDMANQ